MMTGWAKRPLIGFGTVRHARVRPVVNAFSYAGYFLLLPMRSMQAERVGTATALPVNRAGWISFHDQDHGDGRSVQEGGALRWLDELLAAHGIDNANGEAWLQCYPRVLGYAFKPVSFWFCHRASNDQGGALRAIVVEVNNTFGERHCYLLDTPGWGVEMAATKTFHVSPFCEVKGQYNFRFMASDRSGRARTEARIDHGDTAGTLLKTSISGDLEPVTRQAMRRAAWRYPFMTAGVMAHIHWQAIRLWIKRLAFFTKPNPPELLVTRQTPPTAIVHRTLRPLTTTPQMAAQPFDTP